MYNFIAEVFHTIVGASSIIFDLRRKVFAGAKISRNKGNQMIRFGQLIEYNMRHIFLKKPYKKCGKVTSSRPFSKKSNLSISLNQ